jgi:hypothetical protein
MYFCSLYRMMSQLLAYLRSHIELVTILAKPCGTVLWGAASFFCAICVVFSVGLFVTRCACLEVRLSPGEVVLGGDQAAVPFQ